MASLFTQNEDGDRGSKPDPPDYRSRMVRFRLFLLVFSFMLILLIMEKAGQPESWLWMGFEPTGSDQDGGDQGPIDTRLPPQKDRLAKGIDSVQIPKQAEVTSVLENNGENDDYYQIATYDIWNKFYDSLKANERATLFVALKNCRQQLQHEYGYKETVDSLIAKIISAHKTYHSDLLRLIAEIEFDQTERKEAWINVLSRLQKEFDAELRLAITNMADPHSLTLQDFLVLEKIQSTLDAIALSKVEDNHIRSPLAEREARGRLFDKLAERTAGEISTDAKQVSFLELFRQPETYRGELVTITGKARRVYRQTITNNEFGPSQYYVFWLEPKFGPKSPIAVYSLEAPKGFPGLEKNNDGELAAATELNEPIEVSGYFFKKMAYQAQDGWRIAPLVLAKSPSWSAATAAESSEDKPISIPSLIAIAVAAILGGGFLTFVFIRMTKWSNQDLRSRNTTSKIDLS